MSCPPLALLRPGCKNPLAAGRCRPYRRCPRCPDHPWSPVTTMRALLLASALALIVGAGANDMRCPAWHARKLVARLQAEGEGGPFVLRVTGGGHLSTRRGADLVAEWQSFLLRALGIHGPRLGETAAATGSRLR